MTQPIDIKLRQRADRIWDINIDTDGDLEKDDGFGTTIALSFIGRRRATAGEVIVPERRSGWIGNVLSDTPGFEMGSKSWLRNQSRMLPNSPAQIKNDYQSALQWMLDDGLAKSIIITATQNGDSIPVEVNIDGESFFFDGWNNTKV